MAVINAQTVCNVTREQIEKCFRFTDEQTGEVCYKVQSQTTDDEYTVKAIRVNGRFHLTCNCKSGQNGGRCWHRRAAIAHSMEHKALKSAETQELAVVVPMEVVRRDERGGCVFFTVKTATGYVLPVLHKDGVMRCACTAATEGRIASDCEHCKAAQEFEDSFHREMAEYMKSL